MDYLCSITLKQRDMKIKQSRQSRKANLMIAVAVTAASYFVVMTLIGLAS